MSLFRNKKEFENWARDQFNKYGIRQPDTYSAEELKQLNPAVPEWFVDRHVAKRDVANKEHTNA
jgi:hypothetical protein